MTTYGKIKNIISVALKHKIWCAIIIFVVWVAFFDQYSWLLQWKIKQSINALTVEKQYYVNKIQNDSTMYSELQTNDNNLEKARQAFLDRLIANTKVL